MEEEVILWISKPDRDKFKSIAAQKGTSMKALFHKWVNENGNNQR
jgi:hypothetical protein